MKLLEIIPILIWLDTKVSAWRWHVMNLVKADEFPGKVIYVTLAFTIFPLAFSRDKRKGFTKTVICICFIRIGIEYSYIDDI